MKLFLIIIIGMTTCCGLSWTASIINKRAAVGPVWSNKRIPYAFSNIIEFDFEDRAIIKAVLTQIQESIAVNGELCIEFVERTNEKDYILFIDKGDCSSGVGFFPGINNISLSKQCLKVGTIIHEVMHRLGFDHEHSRHDRDQNIFVYVNNSISSVSGNFDKNPLSAQDLDAPYDFHSVIHYNSDALSKSMGEPTLVSRIPVLISETNEIHHAREKLTPIDIYKIQRFYKCPTITIPEIVKEGDSIEAERMEKISERFKLEAELKGINQETVEGYLQKSYEVCGMNHYWPTNYPLVETKHRLYKLMCMRKRQVKESCKFSFECIDEKAVCFRPFLWPTGLCVRPENERINAVVLGLNDAMVKFGKKVKDTYGKVKGWFKPPQ